MAINMIRRNQATVAPSKPLYNHLGYLRSCNAAYTSFVSTASYPPRVVLTPVSRIMLGLSYMAV
jgi:hypothetical protein